MSDMDGFESYEDLESLDDAGDDEVKKEEDKSGEKKAEDKKPEDKKNEEKKPEGSEPPNEGPPKKTKGEIISIALKVAAVLITVAYFFLLIFGKKALWSGQSFYTQPKPLY